MAQSEALSVKIFISSPGDVAQERVLSQRVIDRLQDEFVQRITIDTVVWEHEPCLASSGFQPQIPRASQSDICLILFWSRLGTPLSIDGVHYESGTEYEFRDALDLFNATGSPSLLVYRKTEQRMFSTRESSELALQIIQQQKAVDEFIAKWFRAPDGSFTRAFHEFETLAQFEERLEEHLRKLFGQKLLRAGHDVRARPRWNKGSPFRGLAPFNEAHKDIYFGRTAAIHDVLNASRRQAAEGRAFVLVTGMSGAGKSSLLRAGVVPLLTRPGVIEGIAVWRHAVLRPSPGGSQDDEPIDGLATALLREDALPELMGCDLPELFHTNPQAVVPLIKRGLTQVAEDRQREAGCEDPLQSRLVLVVDQLEELFVNERISPVQRKGFAAALSMLARSNLVWVMATLRSDFYGRLAELPDLMALKEGNGHYDLRAPTLGEIGLMIRKPAQMANLTFDVRPATGEQLDDILCAEAAKDPAALPLLQFTLEALYERRTAEGVLTFAAYEELGGLEGALASRAEHAFSTLSPAMQHEMPQVLAALVSVGTGEDETLAQRRVPLDQLTRKPERSALIKTFVEQRLFVTDRADDGTPVVGVAHEALLRRWPRIEDWVRQNRELLRARAHITAAAALWTSEGKSRAFLLPAGRSLEDGRALVSAYGEALTPEEQEFIAASATAALEHRRRRLFVRTTAAAAAVVMLVAGGMYWFFYVRSHVDYYANRTSRWGIVEGISTVPEQDVRYRSSTYQFYTHGTRGSLFKVNIVNGAGTCARTLLPKMPLAMTKQADLDPLTNIGGLNNEANSPCRLDPSSDKDALCVWDRSQSVYSSFPDILKQPCTWELKTEAGELREERALDRSGRELYKLVFSGPDTAEYKSSQGYALPLVGSGASYLKFGWLNEHPYEGLVKTVHFMNAHGSLKPDRSGKYGVHFEYTPNGLPSRMTYLNRNDMPVRTTDRTAIVTFVYDARDQVTDVVLFDHTGRPTRDDNGVARYKLTYDNHGNVLEIGFFDPNDRPTRAKKIGNSVASMRFTYDQHNGNLTDQTFLDEGQRPTPSAFGYSAISFHYDNRGQPIEQTYLDQAGRPIRSNQEGISGVRFEYDEMERVRTIIYVDEDKKVARHKEGYAKIVLQYDPSGKLISESYLDEQGEATRCSQGYAILQYQYDDNGQKTRETYLDEQGRQMRRADGYAAIRWTYDERGNYTSEMYFDAQDNPTRQRQGYAGIKWSYDTEGRITEVRFVDEENGPVPNKGGAAFISLTYDASGNRTEIAYRDENNKPRSYKDGYAKATYAYDDSGNMVEESYYNELDRPALHKNYYARVWKTYGETNELAKESFFWWKKSGSKDAPVFTMVPTDNIDGCFAYQYKNSVSSNGRSGASPTEQNEKSCLDGNEETQWTLVNTYDERKFLTKEIILGSNKKPHPTRSASTPALYHIPWGVSEIRYTYDSSGNQISEVYYHEEKPVSTYYGFERVQQAYDKRGNWVERKYQDAAGRPRPLRGSRVASEKRVFDERNRKIEHGYFDEGGRRERNAAGFAIQRWTYDDYDQVTGVDFLDEMERPVSISGGFSRVTYDYDYRGNVIEMSFFDENRRRIALHREKLPRGAEYRRNYTEVVELFEHAADHGNAYALNMLGWMYESGHCVERKPWRARAYYVQATAQRDGFGLANLGMLSLKLKEKGEPSDVGEIVRWFKRSAETGNAYGQTNLGMMYAEGVYITKDPVEAVTWFRRAADQNNGPGQSHLGYMYEVGEGIPKDFREAARYYRLAAENEDAGGMANLGLLFLKGLGVEKNETAGAEWLRRAAELGHQSAQYNLGWLYENGRGVRPDKIEAIRWYAIAYANEDVEDVYELPADQQDDKHNKHAPAGVKGRAKNRLEAILNDRIMRDRAAHAMLAEFDAEVGSRQRVDEVPFSDPNCLAALVSGDARSSSGRPLGEAKEVKENCKKGLDNGIARFRRGYKVVGENDSDFFGKLATMLYEYGHGMTILSDTTDRLK